MNIPVLVYTMETSIENDTIGSYEFWGALFVDRRKSYIQGVAAASSVLLSSVSELDTLADAEEDKEEIHKELTRRIRSAYPDAVLEPMVVQEVQKPLRVEWSVLFEANIEECVEEDE